jgi:hypothetical protein
MTSATIVLPHLEARDRTADNSAPALPGRPVWNAAICRGYLATGLEPATQAEPHCTALPIAARKLALSKQARAERDQHHLRQSQKLMQ